MVNRTRFTSIPAAKNSFSSDIVVYAYRFCFLWFIALGCQPRYANSWIAPHDVEKRSISERSYGFACLQVDSYIPNENFNQYFSDRTIRTAVHFMNSQDSIHNYRGTKAHQYANDLIHAINNDLKQNVAMTLPVGNETPVKVPHYSLRIIDDGIFEHFDNELYFYVKKGRNRNLFSRDVIRKYAIQDDSVINLFIMPHHPDSIASSTYFADGSGVTLGTSIKVAGLFENGGPASNYRGLTHHEYGHALGLSHAWGNDACEDTPKHSNCWAQTGKPPCDGPTSNNLMDYNPFQRAITPCQLGIIHRNISNIRSRIRKLVEPTWCELDSTMTVVIADSVIWNRELDLEGNLIIQPGGYLQIDCRLSMPANSKITIYPGGELFVRKGYIHNSCGLEWQGIERLTRKGQNGRMVISPEGSIRQAKSWDPES